MASKRIVITQLSQYVPQPLLQDFLDAKPPIDYLRARESCAETHRSS